MAGGAGEVPGPGHVRTLRDHGKHAGRDGAGRDPTLGRQLFGGLSVPRQRHHQPQPVMTVAGGDSQERPTSARQRENHHAGSALVPTAGRGGGRPGRRRNC